MRLRPLESLEIDPCPIPAEPLPTYVSLASCFTSLSFIFLLVNEQNILYHTMFFFFFLSRFEWHCLDSQCWFSPPYFPTVTFMLWNFLKIISNY